MPFSGHLDPQNRWVKLAKLVPWGIAEQHYQKHFTAKDGNSSYDVIAALGTLIIKEQLNLSDREVTQQIAENPYLQYFLGFKEFKFDVPFNHSSITNFRKRFDKDILAEINEVIVLKKK